MQEFEVGVVYKKNGQLLVAVSQSTLVNCKGGKARIVRPTTIYESARSISVEELCESWGIDLDEFDRLLAEHIRPSKPPSRTRPRGPRRSTEAEDDYWKQTRTGRLARPNF
jgi:hypothetical protein